MPQLFRPMKRGPDGLPVVGTRSKELGVRVPPDPHPDIDVDSRGHVELNRRGMSVAADWRYLKPHLIPKRLKDHVYGASGPDVLSVYRFGEGEFEEGKIDQNLGLAVKSGSTRHGNVVPSFAMHVDEFLGHLAATRDGWIIDEPE